jgi:hypothetical protein
MASYIQGVTDYIPQIQPFQPDYNFLGNILQAKQGKYDVAHKQLNKMYGTLLYSPMTREDNIQQRDKFLQNIDQDIKKMSGLDLSLQENVDAANNVFKSMYDNKGILRDMTITKQYQSELERAENYKNCLNQEECGGSYWNTGVQAMQYKMGEYKKASASDALNMSAPTFTPFINVTEKAVKYSEDLMKNGFNVTTADKSKDGRYIVTTKNGKNLTIPLYQLMQNQYAQDPKIQDMYNTAAYVARKNHIASNLEKFGGDEAAAENDYINIVEQQVAKYKEEAIKQKQNLTGAQAKKQALAEKIKAEGTTGNDDIADSYKLADVDYTQHVQTANHYDQTAKIAGSISTAGDNVKMKAANVDALVARSLMENDFREAAINISNLTGETKIVEDPYAKSYFDHSLAMAKMEKEYQYKTKLEIDKARIDIMKNQAEAEYQKRGPADSNLNTGVFEMATAGTSAPSELTDEQMDMQNYVAEHQTSIEKSASSYVEQSTAYFQNIVNDPQFTSAQKESARTELKTIWGDRYRVDNNTFIGNDGKSVDPTSLLDKTRLMKIYNQALVSRNKGVNNGLYKDFYNNTLDPIAAQYNDNIKVMDISSKIFKENNMNVRSYALSSDQYLKANQKDLFKVLFKSNGDLRSKEEYMGIGLSEDTYNDMTAIYNKVYNSGSSLTDASGNKKPLVKAFIDANAAFGMYAEGKSAGGSVRYGFDAAVPAAFGTRGALTFGENALNSTNALYSSSIAIDKSGTTSAEDASDYAQALNSIVSEIKSGSATTKHINRGFGTVKYLDIALSDPNYKAIHIDFSPSFVKRWEGTKDSKGWGKNADIKKNGITVYIPKNEANNDFTNAYNAKSNDLILNYQPITLSKPQGGNVTISKTATGEYKVSGAFKAYTGKIVDGKLETEYVNPTKIYSSDVGGDNLVKGIQARLDEIDKYNTMYAAGKLPKSFNPDSLPDISSMFSQGQQGNALDIFNKEIGQ